MYKIVHTKGNSDGDGDKIGFFNIIDICIDCLVKKNARKPIPNGSAIDLIRKLIFLLDCGKLKIVFFLFRFFTYDMTLYPQI